MIDPNDIETALAASLPPNLVCHAPTVARAIANAIAGIVDPEDIGQRLSDPVPVAALAALQGRSIVAAGATVRFEAQTSVAGSVGTLQQITISGGSVGGPIIGSIQVIVPAPAAPAAPSGWHIAQPYPMPPNFTGRAAERAALSAWLDHEPGTRVLTLRALGGFGKSALAWHWLTNDVVEERWPRVFWWSFEGADANLSVFLREAATAFGLDPRDHGLRQLADDVLRQLRQPGTLIVLDAFENLLRASSGLAAAHQRDSTQDNDRTCNEPVAEHFLRGACALPGIAGKLLMTTRLRPQALEGAGMAILAGCRELAITALAPEDAESFLRAEGVRGVDADIARACAQSGCHPLSLRILSGVVMNDLHHPGDLSAVGVGEGTDLNVLLSGAYDRLTPRRRTLLSRIACFRGAVSYDALRAVAEQADMLDIDLRDLISRGLLSHDRTTGRFDMHQIVRRYAYDQIAAGRQTVHAQLRDYFAATPPPSMVEKIEQLQPVIELYYHTLLAGQADEAWYIYNHHLHHALYYRFGAYQLLLQLLDAVPRDAEGVPRLTPTQGQIWTLLYSGICCERIGDPARAMQFAEQAATLSERFNRPNYRAHAQILFAMPACDAGLLAKADPAIHAAVEWLEKEEDQNWYGIAIRSLGRVLLLCGRYHEASAALKVAHATYGEQMQFTHGRSVTYENEASLALLRGDADAAIQAGNQALDLAEAGKFYRERAVSRAQIAAAMLLAAEKGAHLDADAVERHLGHALEDCRRQDLIEIEPSVLTYTAHLRWVTGRHTEAQQFISAALDIADRCGYRLLAADAHLLNARIAADIGDRSRARESAFRARDLARCDGPPDYTYHAVYTAAAELLLALDRG